MFIAAHRPGEARDAYRRATEVEPAMTEAWYNLGICLRNEGAYDVAIGCLREALGRTPPFGGAYEALAMLLYELGRSQEAAEIAALWLARDPSNAKAQHVAASMSGANVPTRASDEYVRKHFDAAAAGFDNNLRQLEYRAP
jgi:tetratricopeptide (TPR) repeat protein